MRRGNPCRLSRVMEGIPVYFKKLIEDHKKAVLALEETCLEELQTLAELCKSAVERGNTVFFCGNGGSAADCQHIAAEFVGRFVKERRGLPAIAMTTDTSILTAIGNDYGFENIFCRQVEALVKTGDVLVGISTSGKSENILLALKAAKKQGAFTAALTGSGPNPMSEEADIALAIPHPVTARVQECHILIGHMICDYIDKDY